MSVARVRLALVIGVFAASIVAGGWVLGRGFRVRNAAVGERLFDEVLAHIADRYVDSLDTGTLYTRAAAGLVWELGDPHSVFLDSVRLARVQASITGLIGSLGLDVDVRDGWVNVVAALPGTPAEQVGLRSGDRIVAIDGRSTKNWTTDEARRALRGSPGTAVTVAVERLGTAGTTELVIERETVYVRPVQRALMLAGDVGYVSLRTFSDSAALELAAAIDSLHRAGMRALIFDLRGNPGGLLAQGASVADLFLNSGQAIVTLRGRAQDARRDYVDAHPQAWADLRVAVLVDRGTASASEIVAGALQDHDRAIVIGRPTYGKGSAQSVFSFHEAAGVKLTTARWYTPAGRNIEYVAAPRVGDALAIRDVDARPQFKTDSGRTVYGGGGIVPDVIAGDVINPSPASRRLFAALGTNFRAFRDAVTAEAKVIAGRGVGNAMFEVTPAMRDALYARFERMGVHVARTLFDGGAEYVDRQLGTEVVRAAFGRAAAERRSALLDKVVGEALAKLRAAPTTADLLKGLIP